MKIKFQLLLVFAGMLALMPSCKNDSDEETVMISEVGTWTLSDVEYYYDGKLLDYKGFEIGIWPSLDEYEYTIFVPERMYVFNKDGKGIVVVEGENGDVELSFNYTRRENRINIEFEKTIHIPNPKFEISKEKFTRSFTVDSLYGWSRNIKDEDIERETNGVDGNSSHKLDIVHIFSPKK